MKERRHKSKTIGVPLGEVPPVAKAATPDAGVKRKLEFGPSQEEKKRVAGAGTGGFAEEDLPPAHRSAGSASG